jgi:hypothetical protein
MNKFTLLSVLVMSMLVTACGGNRSVRSSSYVTTQTRYIFSGKTAFGYHKKKKFSFKRYYSPGGYLYGESKAKGKRKGRWYTQGRKLCLSWSGNKYRCRKIKRAGARVHRYNRKGNRVIVTYNRFVSGNKLSWKPSRPATTAKSKPGNGPYGGRPRFRFELYEARVLKGPVKVVKKVYRSRYSGKIRVIRGTMRAGYGRVFLRIRSRITLVEPYRARLYSRQYVRLKLSRHSRQYGYLYFRKFHCYIDNRKVVSHKYRRGRTLTQTHLFIIRHEDVAAALITFNGKEYPLAGMIKGSDGSV